MLGYMMFRRDELRFREYDRYRTFYCGLCHAIGERCGTVGRLALSYEMTFLALLLNSLYDDPLKSGEKRCILHPFRKQPIHSGETIDYCADLSVMTAFYDLRDGWEDERRPDRLAESAVLAGAARKAGERNPRQKEALSAYMKALHEAEKRSEANIDYAGNLTGNMLAEFYAMRDDLYANDLRILGFSVGKFIYLCDCYEDLEQDRKKKNYNPLIPLAEHPSFAADCEAMLSSVMAPGAAAFERLPILEDAELLRNILYSGIWLRFEQATRKREEKNKQ